MSALPATPDLQQEPRRKLWTREEVQTLCEMGFFEGQRYELIYGELIDKMGQKPPHATTLMLVVEWLLALFGAKHLRIQLSIEVSLADRATSEPEPDIAVTRGTTRDYSERHPGGEDLALIVEIAYSSLRQDRVTKVPLYANAGVAEYWVVDIRGRKLIVHRSPENGRYRDVAEYSETDKIAPLDAPAGSEIEIRRLLPD